VKESFVEKLESHFQKNLEGVNPVQQMIRLKAWDRFVEKGLPSKKMAGYQYFPFSQLYNESFEIGDSPEIDRSSFESFIAPQSQKSYIVFANGQYRPDLSDTSGLPSSVIIRSLKDALNGYGNFLQTRLCHTLENETDPFVLLNIALIQRGLFVYIPPKVVIESPIQCIHLIANDRPMLFSPRIHFFLGAFSEASWTYRYHRLKDFEYLSNDVIDIALEEGASLKQLGIVRPCGHGWHLSALRATQKKGSRLDTMTCTRGAKSVRQDYHVSLLGENASCDLKGGAILKEDKQSHVNVLMEHRAPHTHSRQTFKNVLFDTSRTSFEGKIFVEKEAQKTEAYQLNNNLLMSGKAMTNSKPNLEIFADDVKASHGATVAQLSEEHLHYLRSRGIALEDAKRLMISSFVQELLTEIPIPSMRGLLQVKFS